MKRAAFVFVIFGVFAPALQARKLRRLNAA